MLIIFNKRARLLFNINHEVSSFLFFNLNSELAGVRLNKGVKRNPERLKTSQTALQCFDVVNVLIL